MKKLLYKEFVLSMHPMCYVMTLVFPIMCLIPNFPLFIGTLYVVPAFSFLFLGAQKGKQTNDLFYSALLPIRKQDIVKARMISAICMELACLLMLGILIPIKMVIEGAIGPMGQVFTSAGIVSSLAFAVIAYAVVNAIYFLMFYKNGRSVMAPSLIATFFYVIFTFVFGSLLTAVNPPLNPGDPIQPLVPGFYNAFVSIDIGYQFIYLLVALLIYFLANYFVYKEASKRLIRADL